MGCWEAVYILLTRIMRNSKYNDICVFSNCERRIIFYGTINNSIRVIGRSPHQQSSIQHVHCASTIPAGIVFDRGLGVSGRTGYVGGILVPECFFGTLYWVPKGKTKLGHRSAN